MRQQDYMFLLMVLVFALPFPIWALTADWTQRRERRRRKELADKLHLVENG
ncbi:MAG: hypothetical protein JO121_22410 [Deltaproteobacteria bacterium]|jgi:hypothetical protein|nr:hypothetical protein [Deltaproteobacteria bacterium]